MKVADVELVIHRAYGGFRVDAEMAEWLCDNRGWTVVDGGHPDADGDKPKVLVRTGFADYLGVPDGRRVDSAEFRSDPDLVACVRALQLKHKDDGYSAGRERHVRNLKVTRIAVCVGVEDYNDGYERVTHDVYDGNY